MLIDVFDRYSFFYGPRLTISANFNFFQSISCADAPRASIRASGNLRSCLRNPTLRIDRSDPMMLVDTQNTLLSGYLDDSRSARRGPGSDPTKFAHRARFVG